MGQPAVQPETQRAAPIGPWSVLTVALCLLALVLASAGGATASAGAGDRDWIQDDGALSDLRLPVAEREAASGTGTAKVAALPGSGTDRPAGPLQGLLDRATGLPPVRLPPAFAARAPPQPA